ncbi:MAG: polysaccharide pyruvyl transferase family protein [Planctomycetia bacterium]|nr:polysaccharide pyruvyl transferase family protein [Planctomycetia bacterium]
MEKNQLTEYRSNNIDQRKISLLTIHNISNFGSNFQAYALFKFLKDRTNFEVEIIDYFPVYSRRGTIRQTIAKFLYYRDYLQKRRKVRQFLAKNVVLSERSYLNFESLKKYPQNSDFYIVGGDQLWNDLHSCGNDPAFKLPFINGKKFSFGTSLGRRFDQEEINSLKEQIQDFIALGVRERVSVEQLKESGLNNVHHVVDPVLLLERKDYEPFIGKVPCQKYMLVYLTPVSELLNQSIRFIAQSLNLKVVYIGGFGKHCDCDLHLTNLGPEEILSWLVHADFVLAASYHATLFSTLFHKSFAILLPHIKMNERITDFLSWTGLENRLILDDSCLNESLFQSIDFAQTDLAIQKKRDFSQAFLLKQLEMS